MAIRRDDARREILQIWRGFPKAPKGQAIDAMLFFSWLQANRPDLLTFRAVGDKWQVVHGWILRDPLSTNPIVL